MKILSVASARPNFVKLAAVHHALRGAEHTHVILHTGQHHDPLFSDVFFKELDIPLPTVNLGIHGGTNEEQQKRVEAACKESFASLKPDIVLVYGDVNGAAAAARAAAALKVPLGHVEAGLRSFDVSMPEEHNRTVIDQLSTLLFVTEESGMVNLRKEKVTGKAHLVGNTMIDTLVRMLPSVDELALPENTPKDFGLVTLHRPSNVDHPEVLAELVDVLRTFSEYMPIVFPVHLRTKARLEEFGLWKKLSKAVHCLNPQPYLAFLRLVRASHFVLTDSGGIQEETTYLRKKCFTARPNTERPVTVSVGSNELIDLRSAGDQLRVISWIKEGGAEAGRVPPLWDGHAGERIIRVLEAWSRR